MVENIREAFIDNLKSVNWMDEKTKQAAKEKVRLKRLHVLKQSLNILSCNMFWFEYLCVAGGGYDSTDRLSPIYHESNIIRAVFFWGK